MKQWKTYQIAAFIALCILLNIGGKNLAAHFTLPLWLDSFGTMLAAYVGGPVCGCVVGVTGNMIYAMTNRVSLVYGLTSVALALVVGIAADRRALDTLFGAMTLSALASVISIAISVPMNMFFYEGMTGNVWGNGVIGLLREQGVPNALCCVAGQFYIDFLDKFLTMLLLFLVLWVARWAAKKAGAKAASGAEKAAAAALLALCLMAAPSAARAEEVSAPNYGDYVQSVYSSSNGLPCGEANDIVQTNDGLIWIGTYAGLYRYNGREFRWMDFDSVRNANCLYVDAEGRLWIGTNDNGLSICIDEKIVNVVDQARGLPSNTVRSIIQSSDGYYYIGTSGSMQILTLNSGLKKINTLWEVNDAKRAAADVAGHVAAITTDGRAYLLQKGQILSSLRLTGDNETFNTCAFDPLGRLLLGSSTNHVYIYDISSGGFTLLDVHSCGGLTNLNEFRYLSRGELFISADNGVGYMDLSNVFHPVNTNEFDTSIDNMLEDYQGNLWFTSSRLGLLRLAPSNFRDVYSALGMENHVVNAVTRWQGNYYFGTDRGLDAVDEACSKRVTNTLTRQLDGQRVRCLLADSKGGLWVCTYGVGLFEWDSNGVSHLYNGKNSTFGNKSRMVTELSDGTIVATSETGISFIRDHAVECTLGRNEGLENLTVMTVTEMPDGALLAGTNGDGIAVIRDRKVERLITRSDGLSSDVILRTVRDPGSGGVFVVTSNGLCYMAEDGTVSAVDNFPYFNNYDIWFRDDGRMFVTSSAGIYVANREDVIANRRDMKHDLLNARQGLNSALTANSWNYCDENGNLFLACDSGVFIINTRSFQGGSRTYRMMISSVLLDGAPLHVDRGAPILLDRGVSKLELRPEILNYTIQDPSVGYRLEGFENDWNIDYQSALGAIVYTNLPPGDYTFHLAVFDSDMTGVLEERTYEIVKEKAFYDHRGFIVYMLLVPMIAVAWFTWFVMRTQVQRVLDVQRRELTLAHQQIQLGNQTIIAIAKAVDAKDVRTSQHSLRVSQYSVMIAKRLGFSDQECENLRKAALMHDIGKIGIPDSILNKPARLTDEEYAIMKSHVTRGAEILKDFTLIDHVVDGALHHHERYDGRGYPSGMKGEEIPLYGRIIGVADAFDAMTANRVYRKQMDFGYVLNEMRKGRGTQFDPDIVDIMLKLIDDGEINLAELYPQSPEAEG